MLGLIIIALLFIASFAVVCSFKYWVIKLCGGAGILFSAILLVLQMVTTVPAGHAKVATLFGQVKPEVYKEGIHFVNPLLDFTEFDLRQKTHKEDKVGIPAEDKLITSMDVSVQYRTIGEMVPNILQNTGSTEALIEVHLKPKLRSILREQGKGVAQSQDFFKESVQARLQQTLQEGLAEYLSPKGIQVDAVLIRDINLPPVIKTSIEETKKREQEVLKQQAELERYTKEQEQLVSRADAELSAAKLESEKIRALADAEAYKIDAINKMLAKSPNYIELKKVEQWNGVLPLYSGGDNTPILDLRK